MCYILLGFKLFSRVAHVALTVGAATALFRSCPAFSGVIVKYRSCCCVVQRCVVYAWFVVGTVISYLSLVVFGCLVGYDTYHHTFSVLSSLVFDVCCQIQSAPLALWFLTLLRMFQLCSAGYESGMLTYTHV